MIHYTQRTLRILYGIRRGMIGERPAVTDRLEIRSVFAWFPTQKPEWSSLLTLPAIRSEMQLHSSIW